MTQVNISSDAAVTNFGIFQVTLPSLQDALVPVTLPSLLLIFCLDAVPESWSIMSEIA